MFVCPGSGVHEEINSMPGIYHQSVDQIVEECREVEALGVSGVVLFGLPETKDARGTSSLAKDGVIQRAMEAIKKAKLELLVITDVCLCEYTDHGHCGVIENGRCCERCDAADSCGAGIVSCAGGRGYRCAFGHDGRASGCDSEERSTNTSFRTLRSSRTPQNIVRDFTDRFAKQRIPRRSSETVEVTRWIRRMRGRRCGKWRWISRRARTS